MSWRDNAACRGMDPVVFFAPPSEAGLAKTVCGGCEVREACLLDALATEAQGFRHGIRGELLPSQRDVEARRRRYRTPGRPARAACGTDAGYYRHIRREEPTCQPCRDAHTAAVTARQRAG